ncbi:MAG: hypothetical protein ABJG68_12895 [Crocinitomicaceae bacterium]
MKSKLTSIIVLISFINFGQDSTKKSWDTPVKHEIGTDVTALITNTISFGFFPTQPAPFQLIYRYHINPKLALRERIGGYYNSSQGFSNDTNQIKSTYSQLAINSGIELKKQLSKRWQFYYGIDFGYALSGNNNYTEYGVAPYNYESTIKSTTNAFNASPLLGIRFKISPNISLTTESALNCTYSSSNQTYSIIYPNLPNNNIDSKNESTSFNTNISAPIYLYLNISF